MQSTLKNFSLILLGLVILCNFSFANSETKNQTINNDEKIIIDSYKIPAQLTLGKTKLRLDKTLKKNFSLINGAMQIAQLITLSDQKHYVWLLVQIPSKPNSFGHGYCGAGSEDYVFLVSLINSQLKYVDKFLARSCLTNIEINEGQDITDKNIPISAIGNSLTFTQMIYKENQQYSRQIKLEPLSNKIQVSIKEQTINENPP